MIHIALASPGRISRRFLNGMKEIRNGKVTAFASRNPEKVRAFAEEYGVSEIASFRELCGRNEIDAFYLCTPSPVHYEMIKEGLLAGKHVLCEKPIVLKGAQYSELCGLAHRKGLVLMEAHKTLYTPTFRSIREVLAEHRLGRVYEVSAGFCRSEPPEEGEWRGTKEGGGALADVGVYGLAAVFGLFGTDMALQSWSSHPFRDTLGEGEIHLRKGELPLSVRYSFLGDGDCALWIRGETGTLRCESFWKSRSFAIETEEGKEMFEFPFESEFAFETERFLERIERGESRDPESEKVSRKILEVIDVLQG